MVVKPMLRSNMFLNAHPLGCREFVRRQIEYVKAQPRMTGPKNVLVLGSSGSYGLASRIVAAFAADAATIGVSFEKEAKGKRTATAGWYSEQAFLAAAKDAGRYAETFNADAFSHETRAKVIEAIGRDLGTVDLVVYSLASGVRVDPDSGETYYSALKPIGRRYESVTIDAKTGALTQAAIEPAAEAEIAATVKVMGGEDWALWIAALRDAGVLAPRAITVAYSYIGPAVTAPLYREGTIGAAKKHLEATAHELDRELRASGGRALVSVNKALVTRASMAIPAVPLYMALLYRIMKDKSIHEGPIEQMQRMFADRLYGTDLQLDGEGRVRMDDWEMRDDVQQAIASQWGKVTAESLPRVADVAGFTEELYQIHGFGFDTVDYEADVTV